MRLFPRLLLNHLAVMTLMAVVLIVAAELAAHPFIQHHVEEMVRQMGASGAGMRADLSSGMRATLTRALLTALPLALLVATGTAWVAARRVTASVRTLQAGSAAIASGEYARRLPESGQDELADLAHSFNVMAGTLAQVEQTRVDLIGNVAHELRAPVAAVRGYVEAAQDGVMSHGSAMTAIHRELASMERLVSDLSLVSRVEAGQVEVHPQRTSVAELLAHAQQRFAPPFEDKGVDLVVPPLPTTLEAWTDPERAGQILANVLSNALRHTAPGGQVRVTSKTEGEVIYVTVQDTGTGISPEHLDRVFERFFRANTARTRGEGSGVGLTVARGLARALGGDLTVRSSLGQGATFTLSLPLK
ncbi:sensor histidine kinase [Deinococcus multiflagellatus]|uniref:histidine kinase n=1 Tax=Deinococcus multiflagellatus TaxID=1656887 RepID=A0ABW1ZS26_9DEIO|nr:HAMP domain-containing sensor histidine kinase [Deinococcus multiflagellatus]MBZ9715411.1 HAMP domain-containing histidine kinase [Deinococcus multiflagellatus]